MRSSEKINIACNYTAMSHCLLCLYQARMLGELYSIFRGVIV